MLKKTGKSLFLNTKTKSERRFMKRLLSVSGALIMLTGCIGLSKTQEISSRRIVQRDWTSTSTLVRFTNATDSALSVYVEDELVKSNLLARSCFNKEFRCRHMTTNQVRTVSVGDGEVRTVPIILPPENPPFAGPVIVCILR